MANVNDKIKNALDKYNTGLKTKLDARFVQQVDGKNLSANDFTDELKSKLDAVATDTYVTKVDGKNLSSNDFTDNYRSKLDGLDNTYAKKSDVSSVLKYRGTVENFNNLPSDAETGDVFNVKTAGGADENGTPIKAGDNVAKTETGWDCLGGSIDLSSYAQIYIGNTQPTDTSVIWFDTSGYEE